VASPLFEGVVLHNTCLQMEDREVDLDLSLPRGVDRQVDQPGVGICVLGRTIEVLPACELPLLTTQWTVLADS
jgi:hypothetical protein